MATVSVSPLIAELPAASDAAATVSLASLAPGARAVVVSVADDTPAGRRLGDLGFVPGTEVTVVRRAPLGDPVAYELRSTCLCLRRSEAERVQVRRV